jgi:hypothetical protein
MDRRLTEKAIAYTITGFSFALVLCGCESSSDDSNNEPAIEPIVLEGAGDAPFLTDIPYYERLTAYPNERLPMHFELSQPVKRIWVIFMSVNDGQELDGWVTWPNSKVVDAEFRVGCAQPSDTVYPQLAFENAEYSRKVTYYFDPAVSTTNYALRYEMDSEVVEEGIDTRIPVETMEFVQTAMPEDKPDFVINVNSVTVVDSQIQFDYSITNLGTRSGVPGSIEFWPHLDVAPVVGDDGYPNHNFGWSSCLEPGDAESHVYSIDATDAGGTAYAVVDNKQLIEELDESNNVSIPFMW